jgi:hypothetical protein
MRQVKKRQLTVLNNTQGLFCELTLGIPMEQQESAFQELKQLQGLEIKPVATD